MKISGNTILITGGGTGIGKQLALKFKSLGNEVIICGRRENRLAEVSKENPGIHYLACDVASENDRRALYDYVTKDFPETNVIINNGAFQVDRDLSLGEAELDGIEQEVASILTGPMRLNGLFIPFLMEKRAPVIINVTSLLAFIPAPPMPVYCSAKAGFHVYTLLLRARLENTPIKVIEVIPPAVQTELNLEGRKKRTKPGAVYGGLQAEYYADYVINELEKGSIDVFYENEANLSGDRIMNGPRYDVELTNLRPR